MKIKFEFKMGVTFSTLVCCLLSPNIFAENSFDGAIKNATSKGMNLGKFYGHFEDANTANFDLDEWNLIFTYQVTNLLDVEYILAVHDNEATPNDVSTNQTRNLLRINYIFSSYAYW